MDKLLQTFKALAPYLRHPLVLVGFLLLLFYGLAQSLIEAGVIPPLSQYAGSQIAAQLLDNGFVIAFLVIVLGFALAFFQHRHKDNPRLAYSSITLALLVIVLGFAYMFWTTPDGPKQIIIGHTGDITIAQGISDDQFQQLAEEFGVTKAALKSFFKILEQQQVPPEDLDSTLREIAKRYKELQQKLAGFSSDDPVIAKLKQEAKEALEAGNFDRAERLLNEASEKDLKAAQEMQAIARQRLLSAAAFKAANGDLKNTQLAYAEAATYYSQAADLLPEGEDLTLAEYLNQQALALLKAGQYTQAQQPLERALTIREKALGPAHPDVAESLNNLAELYRDQGRYAEAEPLYQRALAIREEVLGPDHPDVATTLNNLAGLYRAQGRYAEAEPLYQRALGILKQALGPEHPHVAIVSNNYERLLKKMSEIAETAPLEVIDETIQAEHAEEAEEMAP